jgi:hypothetical protein
MAGSKGWKIPIAGYEVSEVRLGAQTYLILYGPEADRVQFRFGGDAKLLGADGLSVSLDGEGAWEQLVPVLQLRRQRLDDVAVGSDGRIQLSFEHGISLIVAPDPAYENWELSGPGDLNLVCPPGGGDPRIAGDLPPPS